jgi:Arc/MetJ-type ribon-helix-helix transcriptional regulator
VEAVMSIVLSPDVERQIEDIVRGEGFESADDFFRIFVQSYRKQQQRMLTDLESRREEIDRMLDEGIRDLREGRFTTYDSAGLRDLAEEIKREGRARHNPATPSQ